MSYNQDIIKHNSKPMMLSQQETWSIDTNLLSEILNTSHKVGECKYLCQCIAACCCLCDIHSSHVSIMLFHLFLTVVLSKKLRLDIICNVDFPSKSGFLRAAELGGLTSYWKDDLIAEQFILYLGGTCCHEQRRNWLTSWPCYYVYCILDTVLLNNCKG